MKNSVFDATATDYYKNQLHGKSNIQQIAALARFVDIMGDVFAFNYQSAHYLEGSQEARFEINCLCTAYKRFTQSLLEDLIESVEQGEKFDWSEVNYAPDYQTEIKDLSFDFATYVKSTLGTNHLFDWFFVHESMLGEMPNSFRWECHQIRNFLIQLLHTALLGNIKITEWPFASTTTAEDGQGSAVDSNLN